MADSQWDTVQYVRIVNNYADTVVNHYLNTISIKKGAGNFQTVLKLHFCYFFHQLLKEQ